MGNVLEKTDRSYGIDLLKTISMFMVVVLHVLGHVGVLSQPGTVNYWVAWIMKIGSYCAVNCFALATGYLMSGRRFRYRKIISMWLVVAFYSVVLTAAGMVLFPVFRDFRYLDAVTPVISKEFWYFSAYVGLFFFIPFLNFLIDNLPKKQFFILLLTGFGLFSVTRILSLQDEDPFALIGGYSPFWLMYLYLLGAGIKKYDLFRSVSWKKALLGYACSVLLTLLTKAAIELTLYFDIPKLSGMLYLYGNDRFVSYLSPTIVASAVFFMLFCLKISVPRWMHKPLKWLAPYNFQVYIIHTQFVVWGLMIKSFTVYATKSVPVMALLVLGTSAAIFVACVLIDWLRYQLFRLLKVNQRVDRLADKVVTFSKKKVPALKE